jgi:hypothetical protein
LDTAKYAAAGGYARQQDGKEIKEGAHDLVPGKGAKRAGTNQNRLAAGRVYFSSGHLHARDKI